MGDQALGRVLGLLAAAGLLWAGIGFAGIALTTFLAPYLGLPGAAALTAFLFLLIPFCMVLFFGRSSSGLGGAKQADSVLSAIAVVARERPILAVIGAALFGAAEVFLSSRRNKK